MLAGTHSIQNATTTYSEPQSNAIVISLFYSEDGACNAMGALMSFINVTDDGCIDFNRSLLLTVNRNHSLNYLLPVTLSAGQYMAHIHDIGRDGRLASGVAYPAVTRELTVSGINQGKMLLY